MAHRFVEQDEVEGLAQRTHEGHALLLPDREVRHGGVAFVGEARRGEQRVDLLRAAEARQGVFQLHVLRHGQLPEEAQVLEQAAQRPAPQRLPLRGGVRPRVASVEEDAALVVVSRAVEEGAERRLPGARRRLDKAIFAPPQDNLLPPHLRGGGVRLPGEDRGKHPPQRDGLDHIENVFVIQKGGRSRGAAALCVVTLRADYMPDCASSPAISDPIPSQRLLKEF